MSNISEQIWSEKYQFKHADGTPIDKDVSDTHVRIARALSVNETDPVHMLEFAGALKDYKFLPAGRITGGAGTERNVTLFNCFVMGTIPDSMGGIFDMVKEAALTMQQGGGIGYDFSTIRPKGAPVKGVAADASGPLTFMDVWDAMCRTVMSAGSRRGAMMATMRCDHPDIMDFIKAKSDPNRLRMFNLSVLVTDDFMNAVKNDEPWWFMWEGEQWDSIRAVDLWNAILQSTYDQAEPGVIFIDRINAMNNLHYCETISATNPCGEQPLPPYGACLLGSINLAALIKDPFTDGAGFARSELKKLVAVAVRMMDNVIDVSNFPLEAQLNEAQSKRRIGLGVTGLASALAMMKIVYGSDDAVKWTENIMREIDHAAYDASCELAKEKGSFPLFNADQFLAEGTHTSNLDVRLKGKIREHGIRNSHLTSIAPTGTISLYAGNVSSGIEPIFATEYTRKVLEKDGSKREELVRDFAVEKYWDYIGEGGSNHPDDLPDYFVTAQTLSPADHVRMQAAAQKWVDSAISKTINCPEDISFTDFKDVYMSAWDSGCKGCTTYRPNDITGSILSVEPVPEKAPINMIEKIRDGLFVWYDEAGQVGGASNYEKDAEFQLAAYADRLSVEPVPVIEVKPNAHEWGAEAAEEHYSMKRPDVLQGATYKIKFGDTEHALYVNITNAVNEIGDLKPFEIFLQTKNPAHFVWTTALTRMISAVFRMSDDPSFVIRELQDVFDPAGGAWMKGKYVKSVVAEIGNVIERHMISLGSIPDRREPAEPVPEFTHVTRRADPCPKCGEPMVKEAGCATCKSCGHSACG